MIDHRSYIHLGRIPCHRTQIPLYVNITVKKEHSVLHLETIGFQSTSFELVKGQISGSGFLYTLLYKAECSYVFAI